LAPAYSTASRAHYPASRVKNRTDYNTDGRPQETTASAQSLDDRFGLQGDAVAPGNQAALKPTL
jgi:hypothetical protein